MPATATHLRNLRKIAMVPNANIYEPWWRFDVELLSPAISAGMACGLTDRCVTMLSSSQGCELSNFTLIL